MASKSKAPHAVIGGAHEAFKFQLAGSGKVWSIPLAGSLNVKLARDVAKTARVPEEERLDAMVDVFDRLCPGLTDEVTADELTEVIQLWSEASGITPGESATSSD